MTIYLDMDGVCVDFIGGFGKLIDKPNLYREWPRGGSTYHLEEALGIHATTIAEHINKAGTAFWRNLEPHPWFAHLYQLCCNVGETIFLSTPSPYLYAWQGKVEWLRRQFVHDVPVILIRGSKAALAGTNAVLIDDYRKNVGEFINAGGTGILYPQPWNTANYSYRDDVPGSVIAALREVNG